MTSDSETNQQIKAFQSRPFAKTNTSRRFVGRRGGGGGERKRNATRARATPRKPPTRRRPFIFRQLTRQQRTFPRPSSSLPARPCSAPGRWAGGNQKGGNPWHGPWPMVAVAGWEPKGGNPSPSSWPAARARWKHAVRRCRAHFLWMDTASLHGETPGDFDNPSIPQSQQSHGCSTSGPKCQNSQTLATKGSTHNQH